MIGTLRATRGRRLVLVLGTSALASGLALPGVAHAQCVPEPTKSNGTTNCTGTDSNGLRVTTPGTTVSVASGAVVTNSAAPAITVEVPNTVSPIAEKINVAGQVAGGTQGGIMLLTGPVATYNGSTTRLTLMVAIGGSVAGSTAVGTGQSAGSNYGELVVTLDNAGTITGTSGIALRNDLATTTNGFTTSYSAFDTITNRAGATIAGSIVGPVASLTNAGLIDGGSGSALTTGNAGTAVPYTISSGAWTNSGTIRSNSTAATIVSSTIATLANGGTIANAGTGAALSSNYLPIQNQAGGQISSAGSNAIAGTGYVNLTNLGTITGNVVTGNTASTIDASLGRINGSVTFGSGNDTLVVRYGGTTAPVTGITGTINAGGGTNTEQLEVSADTTIATPVTLLAGFQQFGISIDKSVTATLGAGFVAPTTIQVSGSGTLVNRAAISTTSTAFVVSGAYSPNSGSFVNAGSIQTTSTSAYAITAGGNGFPQITNNGTITSAGGGVSTSQASLVNTGAITAAGTAALLSNNSLTNSGTIRSTGGTGVILSGNVGIASTNSGTIQGATIGVETSGYLTNTGRITATNANGTAVQIDAYGALYNNAGGVVGSGGQAVTGTSFNEIVVNAGTINGTVSLTSSGQSTGSQRYISQGGTLNGNLVLGTDGVLFTDLANTGPGQFAGITGTVTVASGAQLRYRVTGTQSATIAPVGPFAGATYELTSGSSLSLTASGTVTRQVALAGSGSVDLTANLFTTTTTPALATGATLSSSYYAGAASALAITSHGTIAITRAPGSTTGPGTAISLGSGDIFTNLGTITVTDRNTSGTTGISGGSVVNAGSILLDGGVGVSGNLVNTGSIVQVAGGATAIGVGSGTVDNRGLIQVGGIAVTALYGNQITNSGTIASTGGAAITGSSTSTSATIVNAASGTISGTGGTAVRLYSGAFTNAGAVTGSVDIGYGFPTYAGASARSFASSIYVAAGGTIAGNLTFGDGADLLLQTAGSLGVSGVIDGGGGTDIYGRSLTSSGTVAIDPASIRNFEDGLVQAVGTGTVVTATATGTFKGNLYAVGTGSVVNQANIAGTLTTALPFFLTQSGSAGATLFPSSQTLSSLTNAGSVAGGVSGATAAFVNTGSISSTNVYASTVSLYGQQLSFTNSGTISPAATSTSTYPTVIVDSANLSLANSGQITGGVAVQLAASIPGSAPSLAITNSGMIASGNGAAAVDVNAAGFDTVGGTIRIDNSGTVSARGSASNGGGTAFGLQLGASFGTQPFSYALTNSGAIAATSVASSSGGPTQASALVVYGTGLSGTIVNAVGGTISATGGRAYTIVVSDSALNVTNAGTISAAGTVSSVAIQTFDSFNNAVVNTGTITGDILLAAGNDTVDNAGTITGNVMLGAGDDSFVQRVGGTVSGIVDGGAGNDSYTVNTTGGITSLAAAQITNFEQVTQTGTGTGTYSGSFGVATIALAGGTLAVGAGQTLVTTGTTTITGVAGSGALGIVNNGTIAGGITLADGNDTVVNNGTIGGAVRLGGGNDTYVEGVGSQAAGGVDGGGGTNLYRVVLAGDRTGIGARSNFQNLALDGTGTLSLTLDQGFQAIALNGPSLTLTQGSYAVGQIVSGDAATRLSLDGAVGAVQFGAGNDTLMLVTGAQASGTLDGGAGTDTLVLMGSGNGTLGAAQVVNFESGIKQGSGSWTLSGTTAASPTNWAVNAGTLTLAGGNAIADTATVGVAAGATLNLLASETIDTLTGAGSVALGANTLTLGAGNGSGQFAGTVSGSGGLTKTGSGTVDFAGTGSYTGATTANAGRLAVNGSLAGTVIVNSGATFGGTGVVGALTVNNGGIVAPGNSIGTVGVAGNASFAAGSVFQVEVNATGAADRLAVGGVAAIGGGTVQVLAAVGTYNPLTSYTILTAAGGISGRFAGVTSSLAFLTPYLAYGSNAITLELGRNDISFASQALSANGVAVANAIAARGLGDPIYNAILVQTTTGAGTAFNTLSGEIHASVPTILIDSDRRLRDAVLDHDHDLAGLRPGPGLWLQSLGSTLASRAQGGAAAARTTSMGVVGGLDLGLGSLTLGLHAGHLEQHVAIASLASRAEINTELAGGSIAWQPAGGRIMMQGGADYVWHHVDTTRAVATPGLAGTYIAEAPAHTVQAFGEAAAALGSGPIALTPFVRYAHVWERYGALSEFGGPAALSVADEQRGNDLASAGLRLAGTHDLSPGLGIAPNLSVAYLHVWGPLQSVRTETFGGTGPTFTVTGDRLGSGNLDASGGIDLIVHDQLRLGLSGFLTRSNEWRDYGGRASFSVRF